MGLRLNEAFSETMPDWIKRFLNVEGVDANGNSTGTLLEVFRRYFTSDSIDKYYGKGFTQTQGGRHKYNVASNFLTPGVSRAIDKDYPSEIDTQARRDADDSILSSFLLSDIEFKRPVIASGISKGDVGELAYELQGGGVTPRQKDRTNPNLINNLQKILPIYHFVDDSISLEIEDTTTGTLSWIGKLDPEKEFTKYADSTGAHPTKVSCSILAVGDFISKQGIIYKIVSIVAPKGEAIFWPSYKEPEFDAKNNAYKTSTFDKYPDKVIYQTEFTHSFKGAGGYDIRTELISNTQAFSKAQYGTYVDDVVYIDFSDATANSEYRGGNLLRRWRNNDFDFDSLETSIAKMGRDWSRQQNAKYQQNPENEVISNLRYRGSKDDLRRNHYKQGASEAEMQDPANWDKSGYFIQYDVEKPVNVDFYKRGNYFSNSFLRRLEKFYFNLDSGYKSFQYSIPVDATADEAMKIFNQQKNNREKYNSIVEQYNKFASDFKKILENNKRVKQDFTQDKIVELEDELSALMDEATPFLENAFVPFDQFYED